MFVMMTEKIVKSLLIGFYSFQRGTDDISQFVNVGVWNGFFASLNIMTLGRWVEFLLYDEGGIDFDIFLYISLV